MNCGTDQEGTAEIVSLRTFVEDDGARLKGLLSRLYARGNIEGPPRGQHFTCPISILHD
jgi:hypothetical protein